MSRKKTVKRAKTLTDLKRKGSFLRRMYGRARIPALVDARGKPTKFALQAKAWGEAIPKTLAQARELAKEGGSLLQEFRALKGTLTRGSR